MKYRSGIIIYIVIFSILSVSCFREDQLGKLNEYNASINVLSVSPANNTSGVALNTTITAQFSESIDMSTVTSSTFTVNPGGITGTFINNTTADTIMLQPANGLEYGTVYTVTLTKDITNLKKQYMTDNYSWIFSTLNYYFNVISISPAAGTTVPVNSQIIAHFNDNIEISTVSGTTFNINPPVAGGSYSIDPALRIVTYTPPVTNLLPNQPYTITLTAGIKDITLQYNLAADYTWSFLTGPLILPAISISSTLSTLSDGGSFDYGNEIVGTPKSEIFTITNKGTGNLTVSSITLSGPDSVEFSIPVNPTIPIPAVITPGGNATFTVSFTPLSAAAKNAIVTIVSDDFNYGLFAVNLKGTGLGVSAPQIQVTQNGSILVNNSTILNFGNVLVGNFVDIDLLMSNIGTTNLDITSVTSGGTNSDQFTTTFVSPATVLFAVPKSFKIRFSPIAKGTKRASFTFVNNDLTNTPFIIKVVGRGN